MLRRYLVALTAAVLVGVLFIPADAFARGRGSGGGGGGGGGRVSAAHFSGGGGARFVGSAGGARFIGARGPSGVRLGVSSARVVGPAFRTGGVARVARRGGPFPHRFIRRAGLGFPFVAAYPYGGYSYYDDGCIVPQPVLTPFGPQVQLVDICSYPGTYVPY